MKRVESGDKMTKWKPRNKQAGLFLRKAKQEFEPLPVVTPRIIKPSLEELRLAAESMKSKIRNGGVQDVGTRHGKRKVRPFKHSKKPRLNKIVR